MANGDHIKVHITDYSKNDVGKESVWAVDLGNNQARIDNIPFFVGGIVGFNDIVRYEIEDGINEFKELLKSVTSTWVMFWEPTDRTDNEQIVKEWKKITTHLKENKVYYESAIAGMFVIALPIDKTEEENIIWIKALKYSCPIPLMPQKPMSATCSI